MRHELKRLSQKNIDAAIAKADRYRDLNEPEEAQSICLDILDVEPGHQTALRILGLAVTDQFVSARVGLLEAALDAFARLTSEYDRIYHSGVAWERAAKAHLERGEAHSAVTAFEHAMALFEQAERLGPSDAPDPILRWNRCVRLMNEHPLLVGAQDSPRQSEAPLGD